MPFIQPFTLGTKDNPQAGQQDIIPDVQISFGPVNTPQTPSIQADYGTAHDVITDYRINGRYEKDLHRWYGGISSPSGFNGRTCAVVQLATPTLLWICDWTGLQTNSTPQIPDIVPVDINWVLLDEWYILHNIDTGPDSRTPMFRISGTYVFGHLDPDEETLNNVAFGRPPTLRDVVSRTMSPSKRTKRLIDTRTKVR